MCSLVTFCFQSLLISSFFSRPVKNTALTGTSSDFLCAQTETSLFLSSNLHFYGTMRPKFKIEVQFSGRGEAKTNT